MVPHNPEPIEQLRARYPEAVKEVYDLRDPRVFDENRPGNKGPQVFDHEDGLRLIISRERMPDGRVGVHLSASLNVPSMLESVMRKMRSPGYNFRIIAFDRWRELAGLHPLTCRREETAFLGVSAEKGVPHWFIEDTH